MALKTNYKDDVFSGRRKYRMINNADGTVSFEDVTEYSQVGYTFGAADINATNLNIENTMLEHSGTASSTSDRSQRLKVGIRAYDIDGTKYMEATGTLSTSSSTSFVFSAPIIDSDSVISVKAGRASGDVSGEKNAFNYQSIYTIDGQCTVVFPPADDAISIKVRIYIQ